MPVVLCKLRNSSKYMLMVPSFLITPEVKNGSPLDVVSVQLNQLITTQEILDSIQEGRKVY